MNNIPLLNEQIDFLSSTSSIINYVGGIGSGKTFISCVKAIKNATMGRTQLMIGLTYSQARDVIYETLLKVFDLYGMKERTHFTINRSELTIRFCGGGKILIRSAEIGNRLRGLTISDCFIDEAGFLKNNDIYNIVLGRMRECGDGQLHTITSPNGFNWLYDITQQPNCHNIRVSTFKNSFLPDQYIKNLLQQYSTKFISQELFGEFVQMGGTIFEADWIKTDITIIPKSDLQNPKKIRFWDFAFSDGEGDYSAGVLLAKYGSRYVIEDIVRVQKNYTDLKKIIIETARHDGRDTLIGWEQAGQQKGIINDLNAVPELAMYNKRNLVVSKYGHKIKRILPLASLAENGNLFIFNSCNNKTDFLNECNGLTLDDSHTHDDMVDACASAFIMFNTIANSPTSHRGIY